MNDPYAGASRPCDIVMKGGAASGFVYARALTVLAKTYRIQSVGGTSAGAGAAGVAAAAEYGRRMGGEGYAGIERIPEWAGEKVSDGWTRLKHLFGPDESTRKVYEVLTAFFPATRGWPMRVLNVATDAYRGWALGGLAVGLVLLVGLLLPPWTQDAPAFLVRVLAIAFAIATGAAAVVLALVVAVSRDFTTRVPENNFGLCGAFNQGKPAPAEKMTDWLYNLYQRLAGMPADRPLTFGDLKSAVDEHTGHGIVLNVMSINVSLGRPYRLPFRDNDEKYWFSPHEMRRLFPEAVVAAMERAGRGMPEADQFASRGLLPFPTCDDLPIIVAVRMSYALPILFSAVPLWSVDRSRMPDARMRGESVPEPAPERCWFIDGALASNFPVHLFDSPLPRWPTFAINLRKYHPDWKRETEPDHDAWLDRDFCLRGDRGLLREWWTRVDHDPVTRDPTRFKPVDDRARFGRFLGASLATMMNWVDNQQLRLPGYRDRVATVSLKDDEGGGHFDMKPEKIVQIADKGGLAAAELVKHFTDGEGPGEGWRQHRWTRYVTSIQLAAKFVETFERGYTSDLAGDPSYNELLGKLECVPPGCEPLTKGQRLVAERLAAGLVAEERHLPEDTEPDWPSHPAIEPQPMLRLMPDM